MAKPSPNHAGDPMLIALGQAIRAVRKARGMSQEALALSTELDRSYVRGIERGEHNLGMISLHKISRALEIKPSELIRTSGY
jgi:transcriptional regulator with XRE-family HTH domain